MPIGNIGDFSLLPNSDVVSTASYVHVVARGTITRAPGKVWIRKEMLDPTVAGIEGLAQEFFRVIIPHQPETRLYKGLIGIYYVLSEEVPGYKELPVGEVRNFANGTYSGLGQATLLSMFLQEIDLKNGNIGLDDQGRVIKIDGDWSFAAGRGVGPNEFKLTTDAIASLPYPKDFYTYNWLDLTLNDVRYSTSYIVNSTLSVAPQFRSEVNQAMLKVCLLPDSFIDKLVRAHMPASFYDASEPAGAAKFIQLIKDRREELRCSAAQNPSFQEYLSTAAAAVDTASILAQMKSFKTNGEQLVASDEHASLEAEVQAKLALVSLSVECNKLVHTIQTVDGRAFSELLGKNRSRINSKTSNSEELLVVKAELTQAMTIYQCNRLLDAISGHHLGDEDPLLNKSVRRSRERLISNKDNPAELLAIKTELTSVLASRCNKLVDAIQDVSDHALKELAERSRSRISSNGSNVDELLAIKAELTPIVLTHQCNELLEAISGYRLGDEDALLDEFVENSRERLISSRDNPAELLAIKMELIRVLESVKSPEIIAVQEAIQKLRVAATQRFAHGKNAKADKIERALFATPLIEREKVFTQTGPANAVQKALASHGRWERIYYTDGGHQIDVDRAAQTFKELKDRFAEVVGQPPKVDENSSELRPAVDTSGTTSRSR